jgi:hypothetical protein
MGISDWILLGLSGAYLLFNIKNVYASILKSFADNGAKWTLWWLAFGAIFIVGIFISYLAPQYFWIPRWAFILYIVGFFIYRFIYGVPKEDREG